jgi:hypothetical protein
LADDMRERERPARTVWNSCPQSNVDWQSDAGCIANEQDEDSAMTLGTILLVILILALIGAIPTWPYSSGWGYGPSGLLGTVLIVVLILVLLGRV